MERVSRSIVELEILSLSLTAEYVQKTRLTSLHIRERETNEGESRRLNGQIENGHSEIKSICNTDSVSHIPFLSLSPSSDTVCRAELGENNFHSAN